MAVSHPHPRGELSSVRLATAPKPVMPSTCDMQAKYADVLKVEDLKRYLASLPKGLFDLLRGS